MTVKDLLSALSEYIIKDDEVARKQISDVLEENDLIEAAQAFRGGLIAYEADKYDYNIFCADNLNETDIEDFIEEVYHNTEGERIAYLRGVNHTNWDSDDFRVYKDKTDAIQWLADEKNTS